MGGVGIIMSSVRILLTVTIGFLSIISGMDLALIAIRIVGTISGLGIIGLLCVISALVMERHAVLIELRTGETGTTGKGFLHLRLRARTASKVSITSNRGKMGRGSSKVMVRQGR